MWIDNWWLSAWEKKKAFLSVSEQLWRHCRGSEHPLLPSSPRDTQASVCAEDGQEHAKAGEAWLGSSAPRTKKKPPGQRHPGLLPGWSSPRRWTSLQLMTASKLDPRAEKAPLQSPEMPASAQKCKPSQAGILFSLLCSQRLTSVLGTKAGVHLLRARTACRHRSLSHTFLLLPLTLLWRSKRGRRVSARPRLWAHAPAALHLLQSRQHKLSPWHSFGSCACTASPEMEPACSTALHTTAWFSLSSSIHNILLSTISTIHNTITHECSA